MDIEDPNLPNHHIQHELCETRPIYRQGRKLTAIKVYTVNSESQHIYIYGVPSLNLRNEIKNLCTKYGQIEYIHAVKDVVVEQFTECYHVCYKRIQSARISKRLLDNKNFYGGSLHVCYAPEYENVEETRLKFHKRRRDVLLRTQGGLSQLPTYNLSDNPQSSSALTNSKCKRKYLHYDLEPHPLKKTKINSELLDASENNSVLSYSTPLLDDIGPQLYDFNLKNELGNESCNSKSSVDNKHFVPTILKNHSIQKKIVLKNKLVRLL